MGGLDKATARYAMPYTTPQRAAEVGVTLSGALPRRSCATFINSCALVFTHGAGACAPARHSVKTTLMSFFVARHYAALEQVRPVAGGESGLRRRAANFGVG